MSDTSNYPFAIDGYQQLPLFVEKVTLIKADGLNRHRSAIINLENTLNEQGSDEPSNTRVGVLSTNQVKSQLISNIQEKITIYNQLYKMNEYHINLITMMEGNEKGDKTIEYFGNLIKENEKLKNFAKEN